MSCGSEKIFWFRQKKTGVFNNAAAFVATSAVCKPSSIHS